MSKRLQVILSDQEYAEVRRASEAANQSVSEWVRVALRRARRARSSRRQDLKIEAIRAAARCDFPTGDIDQVLADIEAGYRG